MAERKANPFSDEKKLIPHSQYSITSVLLKVLQPAQKPCRSWPIRVRGLWSPRTKGNKGIYPVRVWALCCRWHAQLRGQRAHQLRVGRKEDNKVFRCRRANTIAYTWCLVWVPRSGVKDLQMRALSTAGQSLNVGEFCRTYWFFIRCTVEKKAISWSIFYILLYMSIKCWKKSQKFVSKSCQMHH